MRGYFKSIGKISYEHKNFDNGLAFKYHNPDEAIGGKEMKKYLKFSAAHWHTDTVNETDYFCASEVIRKWDKIVDITKRLQDKYASFNSIISKKIVEGKANFDQLGKCVLVNNEIVNTSRRQEMLGTILNGYMLQN